MKRLLVVAVTAALTTSACTGAPAPEPSPPPTSVAPAPPSTSAAEQALPALVRGALAGRKPVWTADGERTRDVLMRRGPAHCDWDRMIFLWVPRPSGEDRTVFVRDPSGAASYFRLVGSFEPSATMPADATFSGYRADGVELWFARSAPDSAYLTDGTTTERWPRAARFFGCA